MPVLPARVVTVLLCGSGGGLAHAATVNLNATQVYTVPTVAVPNPGATTNGSGTTSTWSFSNTAAAVWSDGTTDDPGSSSNATAPSTDYAVTGTSGSLMSLNSPYLAAGAASTTFYGKSLSLSYGLLNLNSVYSNTGISYAQTYNFNALNVANSTIAFNDAVGPVDKTLATPISFTGSNTLTMAQVGFLSNSTLSGTLSGSGTLNFTTTRYANSPQCLFNITGAGSNYTGNVVLGANQSPSVLNITTTLGTVPAYTIGSNWTLVHGTGATISSGTLFTISTGGALAAQGPAGYNNVTAWLSSGRIDTASTGGLDITANSAEAINMANYPNYASLSLGSYGNNTYTGTLTPGSTGYHLGTGGTGGGILTFQPVIADINSTATPLNIHGNTTLTGANTFTGGTTLSAGFLNVAATENAGVSGPLGKSGTISFAGGTLQFSATNTVDYSARFSSAAGQAYSFDTNGQNVTFASSLASTGSSIAKIGLGTLTLGAANAISGNVTGGTGSGTLLLANTNALQFGLVVTNFDLGFSPSVTSHAFTIGSLSQTGSIALADTSGNAVALSTGGNNGTHSYSGTFTGIGSVTYIGTGTQTISGQSTYSGGTTLAGAATVAANGTATSGPLGTSTVTFAGGTLNGSTSSTFAVVNNLLVNGAGVINNGLTLSGSIAAAPGSSAGTNSLSFNGTSGVSVTISSDISGLNGTINYADNATGNNVNFVGTTAGSLNGSGVAFNLTGSSTIARGLSIGLTAGGTETFQMGALGGTGGIIAPYGNTALTLQVGALNTNATYAGVLNNGIITGTAGASTGLALTKVGTGTLTLTGINSYTGATTISAGKIEAGAAGALGSTTGISVANGGTLLLSGAGALDRVNNAAGITLGAATGTGTATLAVASAGTGTSAVLEGAGASRNGTVNGASVVGLGALTLAANATLDFGAGGVGTVVFSSFTPAGFTLTISDYASSANSLTNVSGTDGKDDRLIFNTSQAANLGEFHFTGAPAAAQILLDTGFYEIVPVPEPATWLAGTLLVGAAVWKSRRVGGAAVRKLTPSGKVIRTPEAS